MNAALHESGPGTMRNCAICPLPDLSTIIWVEPSSTDDSRLQGALPKHDGFQGFETGIRMPAYPPVWTRYREFGSKLGSSASDARDGGVITEWALSARLVWLLPARTLRIRLDPMATFLAPTISRTPAAAAAPSVIGGPGSAFTRVLCLNAKTAT